MVATVRQSFRRAIDNKPQQYCRYRKSIRIHASRLFSDIHRPHGLLAGLLHFAWRCRLMFKPRIIYAHYP